MTRAADPVALRSPALVTFFGRVMARAMRRSFHAVRIATPGAPSLPRGVPVIVYTNHPSWWDPAFIIVLATRCYGERLGFGPIDAAQVQRYRFMARIGGFGIEPGTPTGSRSFLEAGRRILALPDAMLWITAEGRFTDARSRPLRLRRGLAHLARRAPQALLLPLAFEYPFWNERTPEALCQFGAPLPAADLARHDPEEITTILTRWLTHAADALAIAAIARDPTRFTTLLRGNAGIGGIYDLWRRARAALAGKGFNAAHGEPER